MLVKTKRPKTWDWQAFHESPYFWDVEPTSSGMIQSAVDTSHILEEPHVEAEETHCREQAPSFQQTWK